MSTYDAYTLVSNNQSLVSGVGLAVSTNAIRLLDAGRNARISGRDISPGKPIKFRIFINQTFTGAWADLTIAAAFANSSDLTTSLVTYAVLNIQLAELVAGREFEVTMPHLPPEVHGTGREWMGLGFNSTGFAAITAGAITAFISLGDTPNAMKRYAGNYTGP